MILTAEGTNRSGVCFGDSGGPLYVREGGGFFVAGIAVRVRLDRTPVCGGGGIHTLAPAYADWIYEKAPEATPFRLSGGGGCAAATEESLDPTRHSSSYCCSFCVFAAVAPQSSQRY